MSEWLRQLRDLQRAGRDCVRVTVMDVRGSAPREIGATMLVSADDLIGSIGGGQLEYHCTQLAAEKLRDSAAAAGPARLSIPLGAATGQCCGGVVEVLFEPLSAGGADWLEACFRHRKQRTPAALVTSIDAAGRWSRALVTPGGFELGDAPNAKVMDAARRLLEEPGGSAMCLHEGGARILIEPVLDSDFTVAVFGAGHVGSAVVSILTSLECRIRWIDGRHDVLPAAVPGNVTCIESAEPAREARAMPPGTFYLVMTHSHALDYEICEQILARDDVAYCGLIGSVSKRRRFEKRLRGQDLTDAQIDRLVCPIGIGGIEGKKPAEIAVAVAAELLQRRQMHSARSAGGTANVHVLHRPRPR